MCKAGATVVYLLHTNLEKGIVMAKEGKWVHIKFDDDSNLKVTKALERLQAELGYTITMKQFVLHLIESHRSRNKTL